MNHKNAILGSSRAESISAEAHEFDIRLATIVVDAVAWAEHGATSRCAALEGR